MIEPSYVLNAMLIASPFWGDRAESPGERISLYWPIAVEIAREAPTRFWALAAVRLAVEETRLARHVVEGHCDRMPGGRLACDRGRARGVFQLWESACPKAYRYAAGSPESLHEETGCAIRRLQWAVHHCAGRNQDELAGMFSGYRSGSCLWPKAKARAASLRATLRSVS